jgi:DNA-binding transcriptional MerR regulator
VDKSPDAFRTISEVAGDLDLPQHVLRFWETRFNQIRPLKRGGGRRYYRPDDVDLLKGIRHLLYGEGYTIRGVQRILKEEGVRFVMDVWREGAPQPPRAGRGGDVDDSPYAPEGRAASLPPPPVYAPPVYAPGPEPIPDDVDAADPLDDDRLDVVPDRGDATDPGPAAGLPEGRVEPSLGTDAAGLAQRFAPRPSTLVQPAGPASVVPFDRRVAPSFGSEAPAFFDRSRPAAPPAAVPAGEATGTALSRDDVRRLQATLFELLECKRLLDQVR